MDASAGALGRRSPRTGGGARRRSGGDRAAFWTAAPGYHSAGRGGLEREGDMLTARLHRGQPVHPPAPVSIACPRGPGTPLCWPASVGEGRESNGAAYREIPSIILRLRNLLGSRS